MFSICGEISSTSCLPTTSYSENCNLLLLTAIGFDLFWLYFHTFAWVGNEVVVVSLSLDQCLKCFVLEPKLQWFDVCTGQ